MEGSGAEHTPETTYLSDDRREVRFVDEGAIPLAERKPVRMLTRLAALVKTCVALFAAHSLRIHFSKGKTEAVAYFRGEGAKQVRVSLLNNSSGLLSVSE